MAKSPTELTDSSDVIKSLRNYKKALQSINPPKNINDSDLAFKYMAFVVDKLILLIKLLEKREKENLGKSVCCNSEITSSFFRHLLETLSKNLDVRINIIHAINSINMPYTYNSSCDSLHENLRKLDAQIMDELESSRKEWKTVKLLASILALILFVTACAMFLAVSNYTSTYIIIMATFAASGILAPLVGLPINGSRLSLLDYIFFRPTAKQIKLCLDDIRYPMFEAKKESKILLGMWGWVAANHKIQDKNKDTQNVFLNKKDNSTLSIVELVEEKYNEFNRASL